MPFDNFWSVVSTRSLGANSASQVLHMFRGSHSKIQIISNDHEHLDVVMSNGHVLLGSCWQVAC
jgi:hypothetical protein